jgi:hypothetical protein
VQHPARRVSGNTEAVVELVKVIDEISIVSSKLLNSINLQCNVMKNLECNSNAAFGGLHIVVNTEQKDKWSHRIYCSVYVQLTRVRSLQDLYLLQALVKGFHFSNLILFSMPFFA